MVDLVRNGGWHGDIIRPTTSQRINGWTIMSRGGRLCLTKTRVTIRGSPTLEIFPRNAYLAFLESAHYGVER